MIKERFYSFHGVSIKPTDRKRDEMVHEKLALTALIM